MDVKYPTIYVQLSGDDGNGHYIVGKVRQAIHRHLVSAGHSAEEIVEEVRLFTEEATSKDYDHLLMTCMRWVDCG